MDCADVVIVGGGPAGAACAWRLQQSGLDVVVVDAATFPRDKPCAGWITPQVVAALSIDLDDYRGGRVLQPVTGFRVGVIGSSGAACLVRYERPVSYAIRRCEFDHYLLERSRARLACGARATAIRRADGRWIVDDRFAAPMLVGAAGHWCPVATLLNGRVPTPALVAAQEFECALGRLATECRVEPGIVEVDFASDLSGYGWCVRKDDFLNVGFGAYGSHAIAPAASRFVDALIAAGRMPAGLSYRWRGHAYLTRSRPRTVSDGVLLAGDAVGLADPRSGEGIRPAVESGLLAAETIVAADRDYRRERLVRYESLLGRRFVSARPTRTRLWERLSAAMPAGVAMHVLRSPWFIRNVILDRWFLHRSMPAIDLGSRIGRRPKAA